jgi:uncharacterized protein YutE (UPF0331/DUF86 family)
MNDIIINKVQSIQRCVERTREEHLLAGDNFSKDYSRQDAAILNITRSCEQAIDLANHVIKRYKLGIPSSSAESFELLARKKIITDETVQKMKNMVGFRNTAVHQYQGLNLDIVKAVIMSGLDDLLDYTQSIIEHHKLQNPL